ncbi:MAG: DUF1835 domain-containing protein [Lachnospiraceae bacterium]|nr:DUF1835 domain-containing protein [Lachnospiraceae bacterium]
MQAAKNKIVLSTAGGPTSVWMAGKKTPPENPFTGWVEGTAEEVVCLGFMMDVGNIREPADSLYRKELIYSMYAQNQWEQDKEMEKELKKLGDAYAKELLRLKRFLDNGEAVRIWYSDAPYSRCGFYHLCRILKEYDNEIRVVKLPEYVVRGKSITAYKNWGEAAAEEFAGFLVYERNLSKEELHMYAGLWSDLVEDNSPLRAVINGRVIGVPEDFYDFQIWKELTHRPMKEARLIGNILGCSQISVGDWWDAKRIAYYIRQGKIRVARDSEYKYARMICANR